MNAISRRSGEPRRLGRSALLAVSAVAVMLLGACSSEPGTGGNGNSGGGGGSAAVELNPASGPVANTPTWATNSACPTGYRGSAVFRIIQPNGLTTSISQATNDVVAPFHGNLIASIAIVQAYTNVANGGSLELVMICFSGDSLTGKAQFDMTTYLTFSSDGKSYSTSPTVPAGFSPPALPTNVGVP
jgi:hypothetical protein